MAHYTDDEEAGNLSGDDMHPKSQEKEAYSDHGSHPPAAKVNPLALIYNAIRAPSDAMYGIAGATHSVAGAMGTPLATLGFENNIFSTLPYLSIGFGAFNFLYSVIRECVLIQKREPALDVFLNTLNIASSGTLLVTAYANKSQLMSIGSTAFGFVCDALALQALTHFAIAAREYRRVRQRGFFNENKQQLLASTEANLYKSAINVIAWGALALAHWPALAAIAPVLIAIGSIFLIGQGLHTGYEIVFSPRRASP